MSIDTREYVGGNVLGSLLGLEISSHTEFGNCFTWMPLIHCVRPRKNGVVRDGRDILVRKRKNN